MKRCLIAALLFLLVVPAAAQAVPPTGKWSTSPESSTTMTISKTDQSPSVPTGLWARMYVRKGATCRDSTKPGQTTIRFLREELYGVSIKRSRRGFFVSTRHPTYHAKDGSETLTTVNGTFSQRDRVLRLKTHLSLTSGTTKCSTDYQATLRRSRRP